MEYVDDGELFKHITCGDGLNEEEVMRYFRQTLSAVGYCHSLKICHRDLKLENILVTRDQKVKIADFGMAALHQTSQHRLKTPCGSPHYAAPEVIRADKYKGDMVDIWSLGVILYACLARQLPFDAPDIQSLLSLVKKGNYSVPSNISRPARDLIWRILQVNPRDRITIEQMWRHPQLRKYDYLDDFGNGHNPVGPSLSLCGRPVQRRSDIDADVLRHLRSMWHNFEEKDLVRLLLSEE